MTNADKVQALRKKMEEQNLDGFIVPRTDEYLGEYVPACAERLRWLTGFTGSAGVAVVLQDKATVMSDGRYTIQLEDEVDDTLYECENSQEIPLSEWLSRYVTPDMVIGYDPKLHTPDEVDAIVSKKTKLKPVDENLIDLIWDQQLKSPTSKVILFPEEIAGVSAQDKIKNLQHVLSEKGVDAVFLTMSDSIAWLLNIRGGDIPFIPVCLSYALVPAKGKVQWFVNANKLDDDVINTLSNEVEFLEEEKLEGVLKSLKSKIWLDQKRSSIYFKNILEENGSTIFNAEDPCLLPRACKNETEIKAIKAAHMRDARAFIKFEEWLQENWRDQDEISVEKKLQEFRAEAPEFKEPSFNTIAGYGAHGAIVHYRATQKSNVKLGGDSILLLDSGAQYEDGTTDITRNYYFGDMPSDEMKEDYTLVLKGHIALACAVFKKGTIGKDIDALARAPLQAAGKDYAHGTGHGVGCYLSVHEESAGISPRGERALEAGMIISNEPGFYKEGSHGIRIENLVLVKERDADHYCFETITLVPIATNLINYDLMTKSEIKWLDDYHVRVEKVSADL